MSTNAQKTKPFAITIRLGRRKMTLTLRPRKQISSLLKWLLQRVLVGGMLASNFVFAASPAVNALPTGGSVVAGQAVVSSTGSSMNVVQGTDKAILNWNTFNIGSQASVNFQQPGSGSVALNRVLSSDASQIMGQLTATGRVFLVNPSGVIFGPNARVDVGGLVASTLNIKNEDFLAGKYSFNRDGSTGSIVNQGSLNAADGGYIALMAPEVRNEGIVSARLGTVALAAGEAVTLEIQGNDLVSVKVDPATIKTLIENKHLLIADGGQVILSTSAANSLLGSAINSGGTIQAKGLVEKDGAIYLDAGTNGDAVVTGSLDASNDQGKGGTVQVLGNRVGLFEQASVDASGSKGGGTVLIGGDFQGKNAAVHNATQTVVANAATIKADAKETGNGGKVIVWSDHDTAFGGKISATGGSQSGNGGAVEVSGKEILNFQGFVDASAKQGQAGSLLLDPKNITIDVSGSDSALSSNNTFATTASTDVTIAPNSITAIANTGAAVTLQANNDITVNSNITSNNGSGSGGVLTFRAGRSILLNADITSDNSNINLTANDSGAGSDRVAATDAVFTNNHFIDAGTGNVSITMGTKGQSGSITTGKISAANLNITHNGPTAGATTGKIDLGETNITNNMTITANSDRNIANSGGSTGASVIVRGTSTIDVGAGDVTVDAAHTDFNILALTHARNVTINDTNAMRLGASNVSGTLTVSSQGPLSSTGAVAVTGLASFTVTDGGFGYADPYISLINSSNDFQGGVVLSAASYGQSGTGGSASITTAHALNVQSANVANNLTLIAGGDITDSGTITAPGQTTLTAGSTHDITLDSSSNNFANIRIISGKNVTLKDTNEIVFGNVSSGGTSTISGNLAVTAGGTISQYYADYYDYSALSVTGNASFTVTAANSDLKLGPSTNSVSYPGSSNNIAGTVTMATSGSGTFRDIQFRNTNSNAATISGLSGASLRNVLLKYDNASNVDLPAMTLSGNLTVVATDGGITQSGALSVNNSGGSAGYTALTAKTTSDITLTNASNNFYRVTVESARDASIRDSDALDLYNTIHPSRNLSVTTGGALTDTSTSSSVYVINVSSGTATLDSGSTNNITLDNTYNTWNKVGVTAANNVAINSYSNLILDNSTISGTLGLTSTYNTNTLSQVASSAVSAAGATTFSNFTTVNLPESGNSFGNLAVSSTGIMGSITIRENDAITQASAWQVGTTPVTVTTSNDQAITLSQTNNVMGNLIVTQVNNGAVSAGDVYIKETDSDHGITQAGAWTTHGNTRLDSGAYSISLTNTANVLGPLKVTGGTASDSLISIYENDTISDYSAWTIGENTPVTLKAYASNVLGNGNVLLTQTANVLGNLAITGNTVTVTENSNITDQDVSAWTTTGTTTFNAGTHSVTLDNLSNVLGPIALSGSPTSVSIIDNSNLTQASAWTIGSAAVTLDARNHDIDVSTSGNVMGNITINATNGVPTSVSIKEDDAITQGSSAWDLLGVPVTLYAQNDKVITLTNSSNKLGNLAVTGGVVSITENDNITQGSGAWATTGNTTLNPGANAITLSNTANVLGALAIGSSATGVTLTENDNITQASAWNLPSSAITLNSQSHDILLTQSANQLGDLTLTGQNASVTESHNITDANAWTIPGTTTLTAGSNAIVLDANPKSNFGTVKINSALSADITDTNGIIFDTSTVTNGLSVNAGGAITQTGSISADTLLLVGTGYATLTNAANDVNTLAAGFSGGALSYKDANNFSIGNIGGTTGVTIGAHDVTLTSVAGTITSLTSVNASSSSLTVNSGTALTLPQMNIAGPQTYTATSGGITLSSGITSTAAGTITFNSPTTLGSDLTVQSTNSPIVFNDTLAGGTHQLTVNAGTSTADFMGAVSGLGSTSSSSAALQLTSSAGIFHSTLAANNGLAVTGPVTFLDNVTLENGNAASVFAGLVTLGKSGGMDLSGYDGLTFNGGVLLQNGAAAIRSNGSVMIFQGSNTIQGPYGLTLDSGTQSITGLDHLGTNLTSLAVIGKDITVPSGGITIAGAQTYTATSGSNITLSGNVTSTASGDINFDGPVLLGTDSTITSANSAVNFGNTLNGAHDLTVNSGSGAVEFVGKIGRITPVGDGTGASIKLQGSGGATFDETVETASGMTAAGPVWFNKNVTLGDGDTGSTFSDEVISGDNTISAYDGLTFNGDVSLNNGTLTLTTNNSALSFAGDVGGTENLVLNLGSGSVSGLTHLQSNLTGLLINSSSPITLPAITINGAHTYNTGAIITTGDLVGTDITFNNGVTVTQNNLEFNAGTGTVTANDTLNFNANTLKLTGDEINFTHAITGTGHLTLQPSSSNQNIAIGGISATGALDLLASDLQWLPSTLASLTIGRSSGTGILDIVANTNLGTTPLILNGYGGITESGGALTSGQLTLASNGAITLNNSNNAFGAVAINGTPTALTLKNTQNITQAGSAAWVLGTAPITLNAGSHDITLNNAGNSFGTLNLTASNASITEAASTDIGAATLSHDLTAHSSGAIALGTASTSSINVEGNVALTAAGTITQATASPLSIGGTLALTTTHSAGDVEIDNSGASATVLGNTLIGGDFDLTATGHSISQTVGSTAKVAGTFTPLASNVTVGNAGNIFGTLDLAGSANTTYVRQNGVITLGDRVEVGNLTVISEASASTFSGSPITGTAITLNNANNAIHGAISVTTVAPSVNAGGSDVQTGIQQTSGTSLSITGEGSFTAAASTAGSLGVNLSNTGNSFGSLRVNGKTVDVLASGPVIVNGAQAEDHLNITSTGNLTINGTVHTTSGNETLRATGNITLNSGSSLITNAGNIVLSAENGGHFINNSGSSALSTTGGRWLVYTDSKTGNTFGDLDSGNTAVWHQTYATYNPGSVTQNGNRYIFNDQPTATLTGNDVNKTYGDTIDLSTAFTVTGLDAGLTHAYAADTNSTAFTGLPTLTSDGSATSAQVNGGVPYTVAVSNAPTGINGYSIALADGTLTVDKRGLTITASGTKVYDGTTALPGGSVSLNNAVSGDDIYITGNASFIDKNVGVNKTLTLAGLGVAGDASDNYELGSITGTGSITTAALTIGATGVNKVYDGNTVGTVSFGDNRISGDSLTITGTSAYNDKNAGTAKALNVSGISLSGTDAANYTYNTTASTTADITKANLTVTASGINKVYDGTTVATATLDDNRVSGDALTLAYTSAAFGDKNAGTAKGVTVSGISVSGTDADNYAYATVANTQANITRAALTIGATGINKTYDGTNSATVNLSDNRISGDTLSLDYTAASFDTKNIGTAKTVGVSGISISGTDADNYTANTTASTAADISKATLTIAASGVNKVYDGTTLATVNLDDNRITGDSLTLAYSSAAFNTKNVGVAKAVNVSGVSISGSDAGNYDYASTTSTTADITPASLTVSATGVNKTYDGTTIGSASFNDNRISGDSLTITGTTAFNDKNAEIGKTLNISGINVTGTDADNYTYNTSTTTTANINKANLTFSPTGVNKTYDGTVAGSISSLNDNRITGDTLDVEYGAVAFNTKNAGNAKTLNVSGISVTGTDSGNYNYSNTAATTANIAKAILTVDVAGVNKTYDGTTVATVNLSDDRVSGDDLELSYLAAAFNNKNAGTGKTVIVSGINLSGADVGNYSYNIATTTTADISKAALTIGATGVNRTYDGTTAGTATFADNRISGDSLSLSGTATFDDKHVGTAKALHVTGITASGADANNYTYATTKEATANITPAVLTIQASGVNKVYDGSTAGTATFTDNRMSGDSLSISGTAAFNDKNAGTGKTLNVSGITLNGTDAGDYTYTNTAATTADITKAALTVSATGSNKVYDGTNSGSASLSDNRINEDSLSLDYVTAAFDNKNAGIGKLLNVSGISVTGIDAANYTYNTTAATTATISKAVLTVNASGVDKVYDGTTSGTAHFTDNRISGDSLALSGTAAFTNKNVGADKTLHVTGISASGADAENYTYSTSANTTADITPAALTVSATGTNKVYDGTTATSATLSDNRISGDDLVLAYTTAVFNNKNVGSAKSVTVSGVSVSGADAGNYTASDITHTTADITKATLTVSASGINKVYDGTSTATVNLSDNRISGDELALAYSSASFNNKNVGLAKAVNVAGISATGTDAGNYEYASTASTMADVSKATLTVGATGVNKVFDGTTAGNAKFSDNRITGDSLTVNGTAVFEDEKVGAGKTLNISNIALAGTDAGNYQATPTVLATTADIIDFLPVVVPVTPTVTPPAKPEPVIDISLPKVSTGVSVMTIGSTTLGASVTGSVVTLGTGTQQTTLLDATVNSTGAFSFKIPSTVIQTATSNQSIAKEAKLDNGASLPAWLKFNPETATFDATNVPEGGLPLHIVITFQDTGKVLEVLIKP